MSKVSASSAVLLDVPLDIWIQSIFEYIDPGFKQSALFAMLSSCKSLRDTFLPTKTASDGAAMQSDAAILIESIEFEYLIHQKERASGFGHAVASFLAKPFKALLQQ